jgi:hypothetical protein
MIDLGWLRMAIGLLVLAGSVGHVMQNGSVLADRWLGVQLGSGTPVVGIREPRLIGYAGAVDVPATPHLPADASLNRMEAPPRLLASRQPGLDTVDLRRAMVLTE